MGRPEFTHSNTGSTLAPTERFYFLVLPGFSAIELSAGVDILSAANQATNSDRFAWQVISGAEEPVISSSGLKFNVDALLPETRSRESIVICAPTEGLEQLSNHLVQWLRKAYRFGTRIYALGGATPILAKIGLLQRQKISTHWRFLPLFSEQFPHIQAFDTIFEDGQPVVTCSGRSATLELFHSIVAKKCGDAIAQMVADQLLCSSLRRSTDRQIKSNLYRFGTRNSKLAHALRIMEENIETVPQTKKIAEEVGISTRQLERLFQRYLKTTPRNHMTDLRLQRSRLLLQQTDWDVVDVAIAVGFCSTGHFSRVYKNKFGVSPHVDRGGMF
ncbi:helix-turn-helix domain-containing protein [Rhodobacterales bacterium LSUCC1028]|nr:helix-turn-helix domain-containing protein [Rhodobacterales bacterium LSUCC1028]